MIHFNVFFSHPFAQSKHCPASQSAWATHFNFLSNPKVSPPVPMCVVTLVTMRCGMSLVINLFGADLLLFIVRREDKSRCVNLKSLAL